MCKVHVLVSAPLIIVACTKQLPPPATPKHTVPELGTLTPLPEGHGRLVIDVVEGSTTVQRVRMEPQAIQEGSERMRYQFRESIEQLCQQTPCIFDMPLGNLILGFPVIGNSEALQIDLVHVGRETSVYRRSLAVEDRRTRTGYVLGIVGTAIGATAMTTGTALLPIGLAKDNSGLAIAGGTTLGVGTAMLALSIWLMNANAPTYRPGSWTHYPLSIESPAP